MNSFQNNSESEIEAVNDANMVDLDDNEDIDTELWTSLGFAIAQTDYMSLLLSFTLKLCFPSYPVLLLLTLSQFKWNRRLSLINASYLFNTSPPKIAEI